jgi:hypothetical protein
MNNDPYDKLIKVVSHAQRLIIEYIWIAILLIVFFITWYYQKQLNKKNTNNTRMESLYNSSKYFPKLSSIHSGNSQFVFDNKTGTGHIRDYYIASSYNSCCGGDFQDDYVSLIPLKEVIFHGARVLDFELYSVNDDLVVAASGSKSPYLKGTYNSLPLGGNSGILSLIKSHAFSNGTCPNPRDPLFIHLRVKTNIDHYNKLTKYVTETFGSQLLNASYGYEGRSDAPGGGKNIANEKLLDFAGTDDTEAKVIIICDQENKNYRGTSFEELINLSGDSVYLQEKRNREIQYTQFPKDLEEYNKVNLTLTMPDLTNLNDNISANLHFSYGCQMVCMNYQNMDQNMKSYFKKFNNAGSAFILKPEHLRFVNPPMLKTPPAQNPELSYAPKTIDLPMYKTTI